MEKKDKEINQANWFLSAATPVLCKLRNDAQGLHLEICDHYSRKCVYKIESKRIVSSLK